MLYTISVRSSRPAMVEPLEDRRLMSAVAEGLAPAPDDGATRVPAAQIIMQLRKTLAAGGIPAAAALGKVLQLSPFTGFFHS